MKISIIIPNYNGRKILEKNLPKVLESLDSYGEDGEIIITDDCSTDDSINVVNKFIDKNKKSKIKIKILTAEKNQGFSSNVNRGANISDGEILVLLNTDVIPSKDFLAPLLKHFQDGKVFAVGCMDESVEDGKVILRGRGIGKWQRGFLVHSAGNLERKDTLWVSGGSGAFRKSIWDKLGGLDSLYNPFYWEDIDLSYRARKAGFKTLFEKESRVRHEHGEGAIKQKYKPNRVKRIVYRNQFIFVWKNSDFGTLISHIFWLPYHLLKAIFSGDLSFILGLILAFVRFQKILKSRQRERELFVKTDDDVVHSIV